MGSKAFRLNRQDIQEIGKVMAVAGISAALVAGLQAVSTSNLGSLGPLLTAGLTAVIKAVQQWAVDNTKPATN